MAVDPEFGLKRAQTGQEGDWMKLISSVCASAILALGLAGGLCATELYGAVREKPGEAGKGGPA